MHRRPGSVAGSVALQRAKRRTVGCQHMMICALGRDAPQWSMGAHGGDSRFRGIACGPGMRMCYTPRLDIGDPSHPPPRGTAKPAIPHAGLKGIANPCWPMHDWLVSLCLPPLASGQRAARVHWIARRQPSRVGCRRARCAERRQKLFWHLLRAHEHHSGTWQMLLQASYNPS